MDIIQKIENIRVYREGGEPSLHKPVMLLLALSYCYKCNKRMIKFSKLDGDFRNIFLLLNLEGKFENSHYPFGKLENDGMWEVEHSKSLMRTSVGHLHKNELLEKDIHGGFRDEIFQALQNNKNLILTIVTNLLDCYFSQEQHALLLSALNLPVRDGGTDSLKVSDITFEYKNNKHTDLKGRGDKPMAAKQNDYIAYLNSLHNVAANGSNALAESQALNSYFTGIYEAFPLVEDLYQSLNGNNNQVVILTGHASDGKSTVALDVFKRLRNLPLDKPLDVALNEREEVKHSNGKVTIVKDMSELTAQHRLNWLEQGFTEPGSWLIVSNTGPLINSLADYVEKFGGPKDIETDILECLDLPYENGNLTRHTVSGFGKELVVLNMTRLDNVFLGAKVLTKMVAHSAWEYCQGCKAETSCPLRRNRNALHAVSETVEERVRWIYHRLTSYEQRLTLRQMVAHLALSLTGGMNCEGVHKWVKNTQATQDAETDALERILFSEGFFGYRRGEPWAAAESLRAIFLIKRSVFGGPTAVDFERQLLVTGGVNGLNLPDILTGTQQRWRGHAGNAAGVRWRFALRRMLYFFGQQLTTTNQQSDAFLTSFLQSPKLKDYNRWQSVADLVLESKEKRDLKKMCLQVLLEIYSGFSAGQFEDDDALYLTLRRPDRMVIQPTQLIVAKLDAGDFSLCYDASRRLPKLVYKNDLVELPLTLPLLDYIHYRSLGQLGNELAPIHLSQLEWFRAELLNHANSFPSGVIGLLRSGIDGKVRMYKFEIDEQKQKLEKY